LDVAATIIAEVGYDAMTMTAVAERARASIGALYRWFPDKAAIAQALRSQYALELRAKWGPLIESSKNLSVPEFAEALVDQMVAFCRERPAYLPLHAAPIQFVRDPAARRNLRDQFAELFHAYNSEISTERALVVANVSLQIVKGLINLYGETPEDQRDAVTQEVKTALTLYLSCSLRNS
jgi:AcrR family transcriptional regulator